MTTPETPAAAVARRRRAILFVLGSAASFSVVSALVKLAAPAVPVMEIVLFRSLVPALVLLGLVWRSGTWSTLRTRRPVDHAMRSACGLLGMFGFFYGYANLPLAAVTALSFAMPLFLVLVSVPMLGERLTAPRLFAMLLGLAGVMLVVRPWSGVGGLPLFESGVVLGGVVFWALAMISIRRMGIAGERNLTVVTLFSCTCTVVAAVLVVPVWVTPEPGILLLMLLIGAVSCGAQLLMTEGYRSGEVSVLAPFEYSAIVYALLMGWLVWGEVPGAWEAAGILLLVASGLFSWWREGRGS